MVPGVEDRAKSQPPPGQGPLWGSVGAAPSSAPGEAPESSERSSPDPLSRRLLRIAVLLSVLLLAVLANAALHGGGESFNPIAAAAVRTQAAPGARTTIEAIYTSSALAQPIVAHGSGAYNSRMGRSQTTLEVPTATGTERIVSVGDPRTVYMRSATISAGLPADRPWLGFQPWLGRSASTALVGNGTGNQLEMMRAVASDVDAVGEEPVRNVPTRRYRGSIGLDSYSQLLREEGKVASAHQYERLAKLMPEPVEVEAWIDEARMVRRLRVSMTLPAEPGHAPVTVDMRIDLFDFGLAPSVKLPDTEEVFDSTPLVRAELGLLEGESAQHLIAPSGEPLSVSDYRRRSNAICSGIEHRIGALKERAAPERAEFERFARSGGPRSHSDHESLRAFRKISYAFYEPIMRTAEKGLARLGRISPPAHRVAAFHRFMRLSAMYIEINVAETRAVEVGRLKLAQSLSDRLHSIEGPVKGATRAAGLGSICAAQEENES